MTETERMYDPVDIPDEEDAGFDRSERYVDVGREDAGKRIDVLLTEKIPDRSRSSIGKLIEDGNVSVRSAGAPVPEQDLRMSALKSFPDPSSPECRSVPEDVLWMPVLKAGQKARPGEVIRIVFPAPENTEVMPEDIPLDILYEDRDVIVVNKPKGMVVHPAAGHSSGTLVNALLYHCGDSLSGINGVLRPGIVHRIDKDTTGVLVAAKNDAAHRCLAEQLRAHTITRRYRAVVLGNLKTDEGVIDAPIARHPTDRKRMAVCEPGRGREAVTHYRVLERFGNDTYIECRLETGRTHQIRVHMAHIGHPLLGDTVYGPSRCPYLLQGQTLHAMVLGFRHPSTGEYMEFTAPLPDYFEHLLKVLRR